MRTVGQHDFSKQECIHIANGLDFVEMKRKNFKVNVIGTRRLRAPTATDTDKTDLTESSIATVYWKRKVDDGCKAALDLHRRDPNVARDPARESLYNFARLYTLGWKFHGEDHVPHVIPGFKSIPKRDGQNKERYLMFL
jgi:hypothetical protein